MNGAPVEAAGLSLEGPQGWVYRDVAVAAAPGDLVCVAGAGGTGRTSLLLTLAGRMRPDHGQVKVAGLRQPYRIQKVASLAVLAGVNDLEPLLTVGEHLRERLTGLGWFSGPAGHSRARGALGAVGLDLDWGRLTGTLDSVEMTLFGVALALLETPQVVIVDDVGRG